VPTRPPRLRVVVGLLALLLLGPGLALPAAAAGGSSTSVRASEARVEVGAEPDGTEVSLDTTTFLPPGDAGSAADGPHPAVLLTHGFGGDKDDLVDQAQELAAEGYVVLTYSARGFGGSGGRIHLADPDYEIADSRALVDVLAARDDVAQDADGDPRVGLVGASYGGAIALMTAATDPRVDTTVGVITWNDLDRAFFGQDQLLRGLSGPSTPAQVDATSTAGPFKQLWASRFFLSTAADAARSPGAADTGASPLCGRFDPTVCRLFLRAADTGRPSDALRSLLRAHSPAPLLDGLDAPTYLVQGMADSLFGVEQSDATARALAERDVPVAVRWTDGGHDAGAGPTAASDDASVRDWLDHYLRSDDPGAQDLPVPAFVTADGDGDLRRAEAYDVTSSETVDLGGDPQPVLNPPGGQPASLTSVPGLAAAGGTDLASLVPTYGLAALPGQSAAFDSGRLDAADYTGTPQVRLRVTSSSSRATLFLSLWQVPGGDGATPQLTRRLVSPVTVATVPGRPSVVDVALPGATWSVEEGSRLRVLVTSTDQTYAGPRAARADLVSVDYLTLPVVDTAPLGGSDDPLLDRETSWVLAATGLVLLALVGLALVRRARRRRTGADPDLVDVPLVVDGLVKTYSDGHRAVDDVSWRAGRGQVVGLLGPNGAGKTTTLRMVMGLIAPDSGRVHVLGEQVSAGSPVLARVGALIEGPGFLPHLTGRANLEAYWAATGRDPGEAGYDEVLEVAALGGAVDRPVRTYSQGMRQRLGIAQAMLGLPEVLVLDEPTNGLDPPQIAGLRPILHRYAAAGRTVVVSSHLLAEVEQTCTHVVVMHAGRVVVTGTVAELVDSDDTTVLTLAPGADAAAAARVVRGLDGVTDAEATEDPQEPHVVVTASVARAEVVRTAAAAGLDLVGVSSRRQLEEVFLGVIAAASGADDGGAEGPDGGDAAPSRTERLRQVRSR